MSPDDAGNTSLCSGCDAAVEQAILGDQEIGRVGVEVLINRSTPLLVPAQGIPVMLSDQVRAAQLATVHLDRAIFIVGV